MDKLFDKIGICVSGLCLVHCLMLPILLLLFPTLSASLDHFDYNLHIIFGAIVCVSAFIAVHPHCKKSGRKDILILAAAGTLFIIMGMFWGHEVSEVLEHVLTVLGSIILIIAHFKNMRIKHSKCEDIEAPCSGHH